MKARTILFSVLLIAAISCQKNDDTNDTKETMVPVKTDYIGTVTVTYQEQDYDNPDILVIYDPSQDGKTVSITLKKIKFVPQMPVTIDVTIPDVTISSKDGKTVLTCDEVDPISMGGPMSRYKVTGFGGEIQGDNLSFSLNFGSYPTRFSGIEVKQ
jgi:hypothetical protein